MMRYIGTKVVDAEPETTSLGEGYKVVYEDGYRSWSPKKAFEAAYVPTEGMTFGMAIDAIKLGFRVAREGWNGKDMWIAYSPGHKTVTSGSFWSPANANYAYSREGHVAEVLPCITMKTATGEILMGWLASQSDMLASDWGLV